MFPEFQSIPHDQVFIIEWNQVKNKDSLFIMLPVLWGLNKTNTQLHLIIKQLKITS